MPPIFDGDLQAASETADQLRLEGVVAKRRNSIYQPGRRTHTWLKIKLHRAQEVVIGGWREGQGRRSGGVGSLLMGVPTDDWPALCRPGRDRGSTTASSMTSRPSWTRLSRKTSPFFDVPREDARDAHWVTPSLVGEVTYGELTEPGRLRHPVWRGLRHGQVGRRGGLGAAARNVTLGSPRLVRRGLPRQRWPWDVCRPRPWRAGCHDVQDHGILVSFC